jgi:hypothetical protein
MGWFKGKCAGKPQIEWGNVWFPVDFPLTNPLIVRIGGPSSLEAKDLPNAAALLPARPGHQLDRWFGIFYPKNPQGKHQKDVETSSVSRK